jgi:hypothetical protein
MKNICTDCISVKLFVQRIHQEANAKINVFFTEPQYVGKIEEGMTFCAHAQT